MASRRGRQNEERILLDTGGPSYFVRAVTVLSMVAGVFMIGAAVWVVQYLTKLDGSLEPLGARLTVGGLVLLCGLLLSVGLWVYIRLYVLRLVRRGNSIEVTTSRIFFNHIERYDLGDIDDYRSHTSGGSFVTHFFRRTPFDSLQVKGAMLPYILDRKIKHFDAAGISMLIRR